MPIGPWSVNAESAVEYRLRQRIAALESELAQARKEEREACARLCEETGPDDWTGDNCAAAIRARKP